MPRFKVLIGVVSVFFIFTPSCSNLDDSPNLGDGEYLVFGHFYSECDGEWCVEIFRLEDDRLLEDTNDLYPNGQDFYVGNYSELDHSLLEYVSDLIDFFPNTLLGTENNIIGMPDAGDWGGLYVEYNRKGKRVFWLLDQKKDNVPSHLHSFIDKVNEKINFVNNRSRCDLEPDAVLCNAAFVKYYYDKEEGRCKEFVWGGCGGVVPFETLEDCKACETN